MDSFIRDFFAREKTRDIIINGMLIAAGSIICSASLNSILIPHQFVSGGLIGVAILLHYLVPFIPVSIFNFLLNIPVFIAGWFYVRSRFFLYSIFGVFCFTVSLLYVDFTMPVEDKMLAAILAGVIMGAGSGLVLRSKGSGGGVDVLSVILLKKFSIKLGTTTLAFSGFVLLAAAFVFTVDAALYTLVYLFVTARVMDVVVTGLSKRKVVYIISDRWRDISAKIRKDMKKGITVLRGSRAATGKEAVMLFTVATIRESLRIKEIVSGKDPKALIVIQDTMEVQGRRMDNKPDW